MTLDCEKIKGLIYLVGAGPGDAGLITVRGLALLQRAGVVIYDALVSPEILALAPRGAEMIDVGKRAGAARLTQDQINELMAAKAAAGLCVVRLKGGDPYLFGRGAEEAAYLAQRGFDVQVVPGLTAGIAAAGAAGIPVTHRHIASTVSFVTGHEDPAKGESAVDYRALASLIRTGGTVCFYMGISKLNAIAAALMAEGLPGSTPLAVVQWGTTPIQRSVRSTLEHGPADAAKAGVWAPSIIVVGEVAGLDVPGLDSFVRRPLFGRRIVITRSQEQASVLREKLADLGAGVMEAPAIELAEPEDWSAVDAALTSVRDFDWLILTSVNGVTATAGRLRAIGRDARHLAGVKIAAIGSATAAAIRQHLAIEPDLVPATFVAESMAKELIDAGEVRGKRFLLLRADIAREDLPRLLIDAGAQVTEHAVYRTVRPPSLPAVVLESLRAGTVDWITFTSSSTARHTIELLGEDRPLLHKLRIASIGPITSKTVRDMGFDVAVEAQPHDIDGLVAAIREAEK